MNLDWKEIAKKLQAPFAPDDIEWKPQTSGANSDRAYVLAVPYITNRAIQKRLDEVFGVFGWENTYKPTPDGKGYLCGITLHNQDKSVTKWDGSECTHIEPLKGALSGSMKRAAVQLGIGRYLYQLPEFWATAVPIGQKTKHEYGNVIRGKKQGVPNIAWKNPDLPEWALPVLDFEPYLFAISNAKSMTSLKDIFREAWNAAKLNQDEKVQARMKDEYDLRKAALERESAENLSKDTEELKAWVSTQAKSFSLVPERSSVELIYKRLQQSLHDKCADTLVDEKSLLAILEQHFNARVTEIEKHAPEMNVEVMEGEEA